MIKLRDDAGKTEKAGAFRELPATEAGPGGSQGGAPGVEWGQTGDYGCPELSRQEMKPQARHSLSQGEG